MNPLEYIDSPEIHFPQSTKDVGILNEDAACHYIEAQNFRIVARNFQCKSGEIDIIATNESEKLISFIEVKYRKSEYNGHLYGYNSDSSISFTKKRKIIKTAEFFLQKYQSYQEYFGRFDAILIHSKGESQKEIQYIKNAFTPG